MNIYLIFAYCMFIAILLATAVWMLKKYEKTNAVKYLAGVFLGLAILMVAQMVIFTTGDISVALFFDRLGFFGGVWTFSMIFMFSVFFPFPSKSFHRSGNLLWLLPNVFFLPYIFFNQEFLKSVQIIPGGIDEMYGIGFWIFPIVIFLYFFLAIILLSKKIPLASSKTQSPIRIFVVTLILVTGLAVYFDVVRPAMGFARIPISGLYALLLYFASLYVFSRK